jgi:glycine/D-amino acid oxidase-like deaminating enzyme
VRVVDANVYVRPDRGGLLLGGYERDPVHYDAAGLALDLSVLRRLAAMIEEQLPVLRDSVERGSIREHRGGLPTVTPDGDWLVGPVATLPGLFVASGCNVGGVIVRQPPIPWLRSCGG